LIWQNWQLPPAPETEINIENKEFIQLDGREEPVGAIKFCRLSELSCPVGKGSLFLLLALLLK